VCDSILRLAHVEHVVPYTGEEQCTAYPIITTLRYISTWYILSFANHN